MNRFPDFGKELRRPFEVHENCYDCAEFYGPGHGAMGCQGWRASRGFACRDFNRLPDVLPGTCGQMFSPSRRQTQAGPELEPIEQDLPKSNRPTAPEPDPAGPPAIDAPRKDPPAGQTPSQARQQSPAAVPGLDGQRSCTCGNLLRKHERCCAACRAERRKQTMLRRPSRGRLPAASRSDSGVPLPAQGMHATPCRSRAHS